MSLHVGREQSPPKFVGPIPLKTVFVREWKWWLPGALITFVLASVLMSGWPAGIIPNVEYPYTYHGDGLSHSWMVKRAIEGWIFENPRSGYPFGSNFLDYPGSDSGSLLILKMLGMLTGGYPAALNLYFLLSFSVIFVTSFCVLRAIGLALPFAIAAASLFDFLPFHFQRLGHLFYTWYFVVPLFFYAALHIFYAPQARRCQQLTLGRRVACSLAFMAMASFGVYYAAFGVIILATAACSSWIRNRSRDGIKWALFAIGSVVVGVGANVGPNIVYSVANGANPEVGVRLPMEAEQYGLKMMQLILPRADHRVGRLATVTQKYNANYPLINENTTATLGVVGSLGFLLTGVLLLISAVGGKVEDRLRLLTALGGVLFLFGTVGALGALFSATVSPSIRGWNRISVFISFASISVFFICLQFLIEKHFRRPVVIRLATGTALLIAGLYDQTTPACTPCNYQTKAAYELDRDFVRQIERNVPAGSPIYQLPYMPFPEVPPLHRLHAYDLAAGFLHSDTLRWSYGGMKGREGDLFFRALSKEAVEQQLKTIRSLGFAGIYIDKRGFADNGAEVIAKFTTLLGVSPTLHRQDREVVFFRL